MRKCYRLPLITLLVLVAIHGGRRAGAATAEMNPPFHVHLPTLSHEETPGTAAGPAPPSRHFAQGTWTAQVFLSGTYGFDDGDIYLIHAGVGYHIADDLSVNLEFAGGYTFEDDRQSDPNTTLGLELLLRLHAIHEERWTLFFEGGCSVVWFQDDFPPGGTHQNFMPQLGVGITARLGDHASLVLGVRWHHISNARKRGRDRNPGFDGLMPYVGIMIPF